MKIFWSWQSDVLKRENRNLIEAALKDAVERIGADNDVDPATRGQLALDQGTAGKKGAAEIAGSILEKIASCAVFVCDLTPVDRTDAGKALPNPNVCIELGYALHEPGPERVIVVLNLGSGYKPEDLPFDVRGRVVMTYNVPAGANRVARDAAQRRLGRELEAAIRTNIEGHLEQMALDTEIVGVPAAANDRSIWASFSNPLTHHDFHGSGPSTKIEVMEGPRSYMRVIPGGWAGDAPSGLAVHRLRDELAVNAITGPGNVSGDGGASAEGSVAYWFYGRAPELTRDVRCYFSDTGEIWFLFGFPFMNFEGDTLMVPDHIIKAWGLALSSGISFFDKHGASKIRKVEVGCTALKDVKWGGIPHGQKSDSVREEVACVRQSSDWSQEAQVAFLLKAFNKAADAFGRPQELKEPFERKLISFSWRPPAK